VPLLLIVAFEAEERAVVPSPKKVRPSKAWASGPDSMEALLLLVMTAPGAADALPAKPSTPPLLICIVELELGPLLKVKRPMSTTVAPV
jgi:hypothetical protein